MAGAGDVAGAPEGGACETGAFVDVSSPQAIPAVRLSAINPAQTMRRVPMNLGFTERT